MKVLFRKLPRNLTFPPLQVAVLCSININVNKYRRARFLRVDFVFTMLIFITRAYIHIYIFLLFRISEWSSVENESVNFRRCCGILRPICAHRRHTRAQQGCVLLEYHGLRSTRFEIIVIYSISN